MNKKEIEAINFFNEILEEFKSCKSEYTITREDEYGILKYLSIILKLVDKLQKENKQLKRVKEQSQGILSSLKIIYMVHTKDCELTLKDIEKWEKILDK